MFSSLLKGKPTALRQVFIRVIQQQNYAVSCRHNRYLIATGTGSTFPVNKQHVRWKSTYKAAILEEFDKPMAIQTITNDTPLGTEMVRMAVHYCSLNMTDVIKLSATEQNNVLLPTIPGCEFSGEILQVGDYVSQNLKVGDKVVALLAPDHQIGGGLAEESVVSELDCIQTGSVSLQKAALLINSYGTALLAFTKHCELKENDIVIVIAGTGGNGLAAIQLAKNVFKAKVYVIADTDDTSALIREEGAHRSFSVKEGLSKIYKSLETSLKNEKAKVVYDAVGDGLMYVAADFVDPVKGHFLTVDSRYNYDTFPTTKPEFKKTKNAPKVEEGEEDAFVSKIETVNLYMYRDFNNEFYRQIITDTLDLCEEELIVPYVSQTFGLDNVNEAIEFVRSKKGTGKILIDIRKSDVDSDNEDEKKPK